MDIKTAQTALGPDRILIIGVILFLREKGLITGKADMDHLLQACLSIVELLKDQRDPVANIQLNRTRAELEHFFQSFRL